MLRTRGDAWAPAIANLAGPAREEAIAQEIRRGNVPGFLFDWQQVELAGVVNGRRRNLVLEVSPDVIGVGIDPGDYVRTPLDAPHATEAAGRFGCVLPTPRVSDAVWRAARVKLPPKPTPPGPQMTSTARYLAHNQTIRTQLGQAGGAFVAGHKKDVVPSHKPTQVAIYGWHWPNGTPIQPYSTIHEAEYADYSHGVRMVRPVVHLDGEPMTLERVLSDPELAPMLTAPGRN